MGGRSDQCDNKRKNKMLVRRQDKSSIVIDADCRSKMVLWCYSVASYCGCSRETVSIAVSVFDRYLASASGSEALKSFRLFQLAAMTCFYTAIKIHEPQALSPDVFSKLSRGEYSVPELEEMERKILQSTGWRVNPPTAQSFAREFLLLVPSTMMTSATKQKALESARNQIEWSLHDFSFISAKASNIALAALFNAFDEMGLRSTAGDFLLERVISANNMPPVAIIQAALNHGLCKDSIPQHTNNLQTPTRNVQKVAVVSPKSPTHVYGSAY